MDELLQKLQKAEPNDLGILFRDLVDRLAKMAQAQWRRENRPDVWEASEPIWRGLRKAIEDYARSLDPTESDIAYYSSGATADDIVTMAKIASADNHAPEIMESLLRELGSILRSAQAAGERARRAIRLIVEMTPRQTLEDELANIGFLAVKATDERYGPGFTHRSRVALAVLLDEARRTPDGLTAKAVRLGAELAALMDSESRDEDAEIEEPEIVDCGTEVPSLTARVSRDTVADKAELDILGKFDETRSHQVQSKCVEQLRNIGGPVVAEELTSRLSSSPEYTRCRILRALDELAIQCYVPPEDQTQRDRQAGRVKGVLEHLKNVKHDLHAEKPCGLLDQVIDGVSRHHAAILNDL